MVSVWITRPVVQDEHPVGERDGLVDVVGHQQHAEAVFAPQVEQQTRACVSRVSASSAPNGSSSSSSSGSATSARASETRCA